MNLTSITTVGSATVPSPPAATGGIADIEVPGGHVKDPETGGTVKDPENP